MRRKYLRYAFHSPVPSLVIIKATTDCREGEKGLLIIGFGERVLV